MDVDIKKIKAFYDSLTAEKETFTLPFPKLLQHKLIITKEDKGKVIAVAGVGKNNSPFLVVKNRYQNRKIGQKLLAKLIKESAKRKFVYIKGGIFRDNVRQIHICQKLGFETLYTSTLNNREFQMVIRVFDWRGILYKNLLVIAHRVLSILRVKTRLARFL